MIQITWGIYIVILLVTVLYAYYLANKILKETKKDSSLTRNERIGVIVTLITNVVISGTIYYITLHKKLPLKSREIGKYTIVILLIIVFFQFVLGIPLFRISQ